MGSFQPSVMSHLLYTVRHGGVDKPKQQVSQWLRLLAQHFTAKAASQGQGQMRRQQSQAQHDKVVVLSAHNAASMNNLS
jgi:hypothetical protein